MDLPLNGLETKHRDRFQHFGTSVNLELFFMIFIFYEFDFFLRFGLVKKGLVLSMEW